ncbi:flavin-containing monooxygenase/FMO family protein [Coprinopsis sp. MPI-PUGE-AT-0042]|nr:flavin-containing monooxygenase/FMO family protein [Coprinopsis sp. MPI-PUGE-AT-0042]
MDQHYPSFAQEPPTVKRIGVIGAGPAGLAALKVILDSDEFKAGLWQPIVFEAREDVGGVWTPAAPDTSKPDVPPETPLYDALTTNLPHPLMSYTDFPFPPSTPVFPKAGVVLKYLEAYAEHFNLRPYILFNTHVTSVEFSTDTKKWVVTYSQTTVECDLVMVCNGHYSVPRYPSTPGIASWLSSGRASHAMWYRHPLPKHGKTVIVVGAGPSGRDIAAELHSTGHTVIHSMTAQPHEDKGDRLKLRGRIREYGAPGEVVFEDGSIEVGVDHCILATGYEYSYPFFSKEIVQQPSFFPPIPPLPSGLRNTTFGVFPLAQHLWPIQPSQPHYPPTSLAFLGLLVRVSPLPLVEAQAQAALAAFAHPEKLDLTKESVEIMSRYQELRGTLWGTSPESDEVKGIAKAWHRFEPMDQYDYRDRLSEFVGSSLRVPKWERELYWRKDILRETWVALEQSREAEEWVKGVGQGGMQEWVDLLWRLVERDEKSRTVVDPKL